MTQEISMKIIFPSCVLNCQFHMYVNLSACTTVISGWVVVVSSFRDGLCVCARCAHMCEHIKCSPVFLGVSSWGRRLQTVVSPFLLVWFSSSILSPPIYVSALSLTFLQTYDVWLVLISLLLPWLCYRSFFSPWFSCCCSLAQSCGLFATPMNRSIPGFPVHHQLPELAQTHVHWVGDAIKPSHPLLPPSPALNLSQCQDLF